MKHEKLKKTAEMIAGTLTEEELKALIKCLEEVRNGKTEQKNQTIKAAERTEQKRSRQR